MNQTALRLDNGNENENIAHLIFEKYGTGGSISQKSIKRIIEDIYGLPLPSKEPLSQPSLDTFYELLDVDNDGRISF